MGFNQTVTAEESSAGSAVPSEPRPAASSTTSSKPTPHSTREIPADRWSMRAEVIRRQHRHHPPGPGNLLCDRRQHRPVGRRLADQGRPHSPEHHRRFRPDRSAAPQAGPALSDCDRDGRPGCRHRAKQPCRHRQGRSRRHHHRPGFDPDAVGPACFQALLTADRIDVQSS